tara:strand:+ start:293 stop:2407 length:2115 start_codon:yes stop_codon:yes gene_type:complete
VPKVSVPINRFEGGLNNRDAARDIGANFLAEAVNVDVSSVGRVRTLGEFKNLSTSITSNVDNHQPGYGLFKINVDGPPEASGTTTTGEHLVYVNGDAEVYVGPTSNALAAWHSADLGSVSTCKPVFYYADGGLRIADSVLGNASETIALQRLVRSADGYAALTERMDLIDDGFAGPVNADFEDSDAKDCVAAASGAEEGENPSSDFLVQTLPSGTDGLWPASTYTFGASYVYYGNQESKISTGLTNISADGTITLTDGQFPNISVSIGDGDVKLAEIQGMRIYLRDINNPDDEFTMLLDIDFEQGSRISLADDFDSFEDKSGYNVTNDSKNVNSDTRAYAIKQPGLDTYATINGYSSDEKEISFNGNSAYGYKTAVVANQRAFVGNIDYVDSEGRTKVMGDRIQYTPVRKYDLFPQSFYLDIGTNDGDEIVKLAEFKDKLFVYKKDKLFVINIASGSDAGWYVEAELENRGVQSPGAVCKSDLGLVWVNEHGMFSYSEGIQKLSSTIDDATWQTNIEPTTAIVGYVPKKNQILVIGDTNDTSPVGYLYDIQTNSIVNINSTSVLEGDKVSNFVVYGEELVCLADSGTFKRYDPTPAAQTIDIKTKEIDFELPSVDKRFYSIYATYEDGNAAVISAGLDGAAPSDIFLDDTNANALNATSMGTEEFTIATANRGGKSLQIQASGAVSATFELQDLSVILRAKGQR